MIALCATLSISSDSSCCAKVLAAAAEEEATDRPVRNLPPGTNAQTHMCMYIRAYIHVACAYMRIYLSVSEQGSTHRGLAVAGYIGGCGVNNTSCYSYIGESLALLRKALEFEQEREKGERATRREGNSNQVEDTRGLSGYMHAMYMYKCKTGYNDTGLLRLCFSLLVHFCEIFLLPASGG